MNAVDFARELIDIDSTTGREQEAGECLARSLRSLGYRVDEQPVGNGRQNIVATIDSPMVVLSTHYDCVPPHFPSSIRDGRLYGRGSCDAKGILAAQVAALERLRHAGETRVGMLFVVGEERGSDGANVANASPIGSHFLINGEPTDSRLAIATRGNLRVRLRATGRAAHSSVPEHGISAIDKLLDALMQLRAIELPADPDLGRTFYSIGLIEGGVAPNVISPHASAEVMFRTIGPPEPLLALMEQLSACSPATIVRRRQHIPTPAGPVTAEPRIRTDAQRASRETKHRLEDPSRDGADERGAQEPVLPRPRDADGPRTAAGRRVHAFAARSSAAAKRWSAIHRPYCCSRDGSRQGVRDHLG